MVRWEEEVEVEVPGRDELRQSAPRSDLKRPDVELFNGGLQHVEILLTGPDQEELVSSSGTMVTSRTGPIGRGCAGCWRLASPGGRDLLAPQFVRERPEDKPLLPPNLTTAAEQQVDGCCHVSAWRVESYDEELHR
jgi:hypothetical protein